MRTVLPLNHKIWLFEVPSSRLPVCRYEKRTELPECLVQQMRQKYASPTGTYVGFLEGKADVKPLRRGTKIARSITLLISSGTLCALVHSYAPICLI